MKINRLHVKRIAAFVCGICFVLSLNHVFSLFRMQAEAYGVGEFGYNIWSLLGFIAAFWLFSRMLERRDTRLHCVAAASGLLMSAAIVYGAYAHFENDIFLSARVVWLQFAVMAGLATVTIPASEEIFLQFDRLNQYGEQECQRGTKKRYFFIIWAFVFAAYLPIFLWFWPGNFVYDAPFQMGEVVWNSYNTHHPLLHTLLMGAAYKFGVWLGDASTGFQFYTLFQMLILSAAFAYCAYYLYRRGVRRMYRVCVVLWFALFPMHAVFSISATKDIMFSAFFLWFMIFVVRLLFDRERFCWYTYAGLILSGVLSCVMRHNMIYAIAAGTVVILLFVKRSRKEKLFTAGILAAVYILTSLAQAGLTAATDAKTNDRYRETFGMALQCLARVAAYRPEDVSETDYEEICIYMEEEEMLTYNPYLADNAKSATNEEVLKDNFVNFMKFFVKLGLKFPDEYIEAWVTNTMGYWYPLDRGVYAVNPIDFYHKLIWTEHEIVKRSYLDWPKVIYEPLYYYGDYVKAPVLGYLHRPDCWIWFLTYFLFWSIYKKRRDACLISVIPLMYLGTCYLGPVAVLRYIYCLIVIVPLMGYVVMRSRAEGERRIEE